MRESIGGTALFFIFAVFLITLAFIIGFTINYMSAYRANNFLISELEQHNGAVRDNAASYIKEKYGYNISSDGVDMCVISVPGSGLTGGVVIRTYTYMRFRIPLFPITIPITVRGETKTIQNVTVQTVKQNNPAIKDCVGE